MKPVLWLSYALKNLRSGLKGFWILLTCLTLGVASIAIIGSLGAAIERGLTEQGQPLLGGDIEFSLIHREVNEKEKAFIASLGHLSRVATLRAMATANGRSTLVEIKAADDAYPLFGAMGYEQSALQPPVTSGRSPEGVAVDPLLLGRLGLKVGDTFKIGTSVLAVHAVITNEPDRISDGIVLGPRLLMSHQALQTTGLIQPGSLITWRYRVRLPEGATLAEAKAIVERANTQFPDSGWRVRARDNAAAGAERFVERLSYFMSLVGISALVIGGAGIANAVSAFVSRRTATIATLKCLGISQANVFGLFLTEIVLVALLGITIALLAGAATPWLASTLFGDVLPLPVATAIAWWPLGFAALLGLLVTVAFAIVPLARIARIPGTALFRSHLVEGGGFAWAYIAVALAILMIASLLIYMAFDNGRITLYYLGGLAASFVVLALLAIALLRSVALLPQARPLLLRQAVKALHRPGSSALSVILALGLGLTLFVALALTDATISREIRAGIPGKAPAFFFLDVRNDELPAFREAATKEPGVKEVENAPMLRGRMVAVKGIASDKVVAKPEAAWALRGDRGLTYAETLPEGSELVKGEWWPKDYSGKPLVSLVDEIADGLGIDIGDEITVNVLGRDVTAEVASLRKVNWRSFGINFVMVFSPNTLKAAPHSHVVTVEMEGGDEAAFLNSMAADFPSVTAVRVKEALATVSDLLGQMLSAVRGANALTLLTGVLVLAGALAAGLATRSYEAVVLKTYGATRRQLLWSFMLEFGLLGLVAAIFGVIAGSLAAWFLALYILEMDFAFLPMVAIITALIAMLLTTLAGLTVTARALSAKPSAYLRNE
jgi:putative ABC transport system permease protein